MIIPVPVNSWTVALFITLLVWGLLYLNGAFTSHGVMDFGPALMAWSVSFAILALWLGVIIGWLFK